MWWKKKAAPAGRKPPLRANVPGADAIELVEYYEQFAAYYADAEPETKRWFVQNMGPDWTVLDCGANIGCFSILFSRLAPQGRVYAFEPTSTYDMLLVNLAHHHADNVTPIRLAVGKDSGTRTDAIYRIWGREPERQEYPFTTVDEFVGSRNLSRVDCIKIDVDSFDFEVLQGSVRTLERFNPYVMVELNHALNCRGQCSTQALEWMAGRGYASCLSLDYDNFLFKRGASPAADSANSRSLTVVFRHGPE